MIANLDSYNDEFDEINDLEEVPNDLSSRLEMEYCSGCGVKIKAHLRCTECQILTGPGHVERRAPIDGLCRSCQAWKKRVDARKAAAPTQVEPYHPLALPAPSAPVEAAPGVVLVRFPGQTWPPRRPQLSKFQESRNKRLWRLVFERGFG